MAIEPEQSILDLTARTATADSDLIHVNSGGTDYKETKANFLRGDLYHTFATDSLLTTQVDALPVGNYFGYISSYGHQSETGVPVNYSCYVKAEKISSGYAYIELWSTRDAEGSNYASGGHYIATEVSGIWSGWTKVPTRSEMDSTCKTIAFVNTSSITSQVDALGSFACVFGTVANSSSVQDTLGLPVATSGRIQAQSYNANYKEIKFIPNGTSQNVYVLKKSNGTWQSTWTIEPTRDEITSINNSLANNGAIDGVRILTSGSNFRYVRIKRESSQTSFYGMGLILTYANHRACIFSLGPQTPSILPLGSTTPTGTYSYSSGVNTAVIDLGAGGQGLVILGGTLGRSSNTTIELLASL